MSGLKVKKEGKRGKNFTMVEKNFLVDLVDGHRHILENKQTDATTNDMKNKAWDTVTDKYNFSNTSGIRLPNQLKELYKVLKKSARQNRNNDRIELLKTGGGTFCPKSSEVDFKLQSLLKDQFEPDRNEYDDSALLFNDGTKTIGTNTPNYFHTVDPNVHTPLSPPPRAPLPSTSSTNDVGCVDDRAVEPTTYVDPQSLLSQVSAVPSSSIPRPSSSWPKPKQNLSAAVEKRKSISNLADSIIERKKFKNTYDEKANTEKLRLLVDKAGLLETERELKQKDLEMKENEKEKQETFNNKKMEILEIERQTKLVGLETAKFERNIKELEYKIKLKEYENLYA